MWSFLSVDVFVLCVYCESLCYFAVSKIDLPPCIYSMCKIKDAGRNVEPCCWFLWLFVVVVVLLLGLVFRGLAFQILLLLSVTREA